MVDFITELAIGYNYPMIIMYRQSVLVGSLDWWLLIGPSEAGQEVILNVRHL